VRRPGGSWQHKIKLSEQAIKVSTPGLQQVRRFSDEKEFLADMIYDAESGIVSQTKQGCVMIDPTDVTRQKRIPASTPHTDLLVPVFREGKCVYQSPPVEAIRQHVRSQEAKFHRGIRRFVNPHRYPVGLERGLHELKMRLVLAARGLQDACEPGAEAPGTKSATPKKTSRKSRA
jgi:nicotinate phosphoribosyltransferase